MNRNPNGKKRSHRTRQLKEEQAVTAEKGLIGEAVSTAGGI